MVILELNMDSDEYCPTCGSNNTNLIYEYADEDDYIIEYFCESCGNSWSDKEEEIIDN